MTPPGELWPKAKQRGQTLKRTGSTGGPTDRSNFATLERVRTRRNWLSGMLPDRKTLFQRRRWESASKRYAIRKKNWKPMNAKIAHQIKANSTRDKSPRRMLLSMARPTTS